MKATSFEEWMGGHRGYILEHRGLAHSLFKRLHVYCTDKRFLQIVFKELYHIVLGFPFHIAGAISTTRDEDLLDILSRNLYAEVGGDDGERHIEIYKRLLIASGVSDARPITKKLWRETVRLESTCARLYGSSNMGTKLGALHAFEFMSSPMVACWDKALRGVTWLSPRDYAFFTIHIDIEAHHAADITNCCSKYWHDPNFKETFRRSTQEVMGCLERFWDRVEGCGNSFITNT